MLFHSECQEAHGTVADGTHTVGLCGIEIDAVALFQHNGLAAKEELHGTFQDKVELLTRMRVLVNGVYTYVHFCLRKENKSFKIKRKILYC